MTQHMKTRTKVAGACFLAAVSFAAGALTAGSRHWFEPVVHVAIRNDSGEDVESLVLEHASGNARGVITLPALKDGASTGTSFYVRGEGGYRLSARFADARTLASGGFYVEGGYSTTETIGKSAIVSGAGFP